MKAIEIVYLTLLFIGCFLVAELIVGGLLLLESPFQRFVVRVAFQLLFYGMVYLFFDTRDMSRRLRKMEELLAEKVTEGDENTSAKAEGQEL